MNNNRKLYFHIDSGTSADQIFALLDIAHCDNEDETEKLMNDSDTEFIAPEDIKLTGNRENASVLTSEASAPVVDKLETKKKTKKREENAPIIRKRSVSLHSPENCLFEGGVFYQFGGSASAFDIY